MTIYSDRRVVALMTMIALMMTMMMKLIIELLKLYQQIAGAAAHRILLVSRSMIHSVHQTKANRRRVMSNSATQRGRENKRQALMDNVTLWGQGALSGDRTAVNGQDVTR